MRTVAIVGSAPTTAFMAAHEPPQTEIWASGIAFRVFRRIDRWFDIHADGKENPDPAYPYWLKTFPGFVYTVMGEGNTIRYPVEEVTAEFGEYLTSTPAFMLALALHEGVDEVHLYGIDMAEGEYLEMRPAMHYLLGIAKGQGVKVVVPPQSKLLEPVA